MFDIRIGLFDIKNLYLDTKNIYVARIQEKICHIFVAAILDWTSCENLVIFVKSPDFRPQLILFSILNSLKINLQTLIPEYW